VTERTQRALAKAGRVDAIGAHVPPHEIDEVRLIGSWLASHPDAPQLPLRPTPSAGDLAQFLRLRSERQLDHDGLDGIRAHAHV
jgi:hypothetical protein